MKRMEESFDLEFSCPNCNRVLDITIDDHFGNNKVECYNCKLEWPLNVNTGNIHIVPDPDDGDW